MGFRIAAIRLLIVVPNVIIFILACGMVAVSAHILTGVDVVLDGVQSTHSSAAVFLTAGVVIGLISFVAICGVAADNRCMLIAYAVLAAVAIILEVSL